MEPLGTECDVFIKAGTTAQVYRPEQLLALGAMGIALGALLAATVPPTRREDELMGQKSDELTGKLKHKAREGYEMASAEGEHLASQVKHDLERDHGQPASRPH